MKNEEIKKAVRQGYSKIAKDSGSCHCRPKSCCGSPGTADTISKNIGYSEEEMGSAPEGANLGLGCGNPTALASLKEGETVIDLGCGAGFDTFLAANMVGQTGRVIGIDMTPDMLQNARANAEKGGYQNVEFRLGEIENLPVADSCADIIISNCVINLSPDKPGVFREAFRALKPGGRLMVSDIVLLKELPDNIRESVSAYVGCVAGALMKGDYLATIKEAGFQSVKVIDETIYPIKSMAGDLAGGSAIDKLSVRQKDDATDFRNSVASIKVRAVKPG